MGKWIYAMSILGCLFVVYVAFRISYKYIFSDKQEDGCIKYGCGVVLVFFGIYLVFFTLASLDGILKADIPKVRKHQETSSYKADDNFVFICTGEESRKYHSRLECKGLLKCTGDIEEIPKDEAEGMGRTPCKICYN